MWYRRYNPTFVHGGKALSSVRLKNYELIDSSTYIILKLKIVLKNFKNTKCTITLKL